MWRDIRHAISYMPEEMKRYDLHIDNKAYNMGIFGGTDIDFIQRRRLPEQSLQYQYPAGKHQCDLCLSERRQRILLLSNR